jgi:hypothetical protein
MATSTWFGGFGLFSDMADWQPSGVPGVGDLGIVDRGAVLAVRQHVAATIELNGGTEGRPAFLILADASVAAVSMPTALPEQPYTSTSAPAADGTIVAVGRDAIGTLTVGSYADPERAPPPYGHGPLAAPDHADIIVAPDAQLRAGFTVAWGSSLRIAGAAGAAFIATAGTLAGGDAMIAVPLEGRGSILLTNGPADYTGQAATGTLELGSAVGASETIAIRMGHLLIDRPLAFHGTLDIAPSENPAGGVDRHGPQSVLLKGLTATSYGFDDGTHTLLLYAGDHVVDQVAFARDITASSFGTGFGAAIGIAQTADGVFLRGQYSGYPPGATGIPLHIGTS